MIWQLLCPVFVLFSRRNNSMFGCQCLAVHVRPMLGCSCSPVHVLLSMMLSCWAMGCPTTNDSSPRRVLPHRDWQCGAWQQQQVDCMIVCMYVCMYVCMIWQLLCPAFVLLSRRNNSMFRLLWASGLLLSVQKIRPVNAWLSMFSPCWAVHVRLCMFCCP